MKGSIVREFITVTLQAESLELLIENANEIQVEFCRTLLFFGILFDWRKWYLMKFFRSNQALQTFGRWLCPGQSFYTRHKFSFTKVRVSTCYERKIYVIIVNMYLVIHFDLLVNFFYDVSSLCPQKTSGKLRFSDVFRNYRSRTLA